MAAERETGELVQRGARVVLRPIANPLPLGFLALAAGTLLTAGLQLGWLSVGEGDEVALILIAFVFPLQLLTSIFGFLARDVIAGTGMGILAGTWLSIGLVGLTNAPGSTSDALGLLLLLAAVAIAVPATVAGAGKVVAAAVLGTTSLRFATLGIYQLTAGAGWEDATGLVGLVLCALAIYTALAMAWEDAQRRTLLPLGRRGLGRDSIEGGLATQLRRIEGEAGVREQL